MTSMAPSLVIDLDPAIEWNGGKYDALELAEPTAAQVIKAQAEIKGSVTMETLSRFRVMLVAVVSGKPRQVIEQMPISKLNEAAVYCEGFISAGLPTGEN